MTTTELDLSESGLVTAQQAADILGTSRAYVWQLKSRGQLRAYSIGRAPFFKRSEVESYRDTHPKLGSVTTQS